MRGARENFSRIGSRITPRLDWTGCRPPTCLQHRGFRTQGSLEGNLVPVLKGPNRKVAQLVYLASPPSLASCRGFERLF